MMDFTAPQQPKPQAHDKNAWAQAKDGINPGAGSSSSHKKNYLKRVFFSKKILLALSMGIFIIIAVIIFRTTYHHITYAGIDTKRYQAVYLTNNNVYFGRVHVLVNGDTFLTDVFRVQANTTTNDQNSTATKTSTSDDSSGIRLIKPGKELHAPDDTMLIKKDSILFIENLKTNGKVTQAIIDYHRQGAGN